MRSSSGPCGLSAQRLFASAISSAAAGEAMATRNTSSKRIRAIAAPKAQQGPVYSAPDREYFEKLAHLRRGKQLVRLGGERRVMQGALDIRFAEHFRDAAIDEELRLRGVTEDLEPGVARGVGEGAEVDMGGHVLLAGVQERVAVRLVTVMAHQSARRALRVVVLVPWKAVVDDEDRAFGQPLAERANPGARRESDLALIGGGHLDRPRFFEQLAARRLFRPDEFSVPQRHASFHDAALGPGHRVHRHRVDDFVGDDRAGQARRQAVDELHSVSEARALALAQLGAGLSDEVFTRRFSEQGLGERAAAGPYFKHRTADLP